MATRATLEDLLKQSMDGLLDVFSAPPNSPQQPVKRPSETLSVDGEADLDQGSLLYANWPQSNNQPGMSSGVVSNQTNSSTAQASPHPNTSRASRLKRCASTLSELDRERKRRTDQAYRERVRKNKEEMQLNLETLKVENEHLKKENALLKEDNGSMHQTLRDQAKEIGRLRSDLSQLKSEHEKQTVLVQTLSGLLADPVWLENEKLKDENASLRKKGNFGSKEALLAEENAKLRNENKVLKVQNGALCGKIISDSDQKRETEQEV